MTTAENPPAHFCPGCAARLKFYGRYPWHFCNDCREMAVDGEGRALGFGNVSLSGGLCWFYRDAPELVDESALQVACLINDRAVIVGEARFGGVVAEPLSSAAPPGLVADRHTVDLRRGPALQAARERLRPRNRQVHQSGC